MNASAPGRVSVEYYLYMKYSPDLVIISLSNDDTQLIPRDCVDFKKINYKQVTSDNAQITFDWIISQTQKPSINKLIKQGIKNSLIYETFFDISHTIKLITNKLNRLELTKKKFNLKIQP